MRTATIPRKNSRSLPAFDDRRTFTVAEVAEIVGISRSTAYECVRRGEIPSRRFGRRIVVLRHELERMLGPIATANPSHGVSVR
ncbi:MAG: helix-turn-helix domain-containing protein [Ilumatobacteraceae bacterium]